MKNNDPHKAREAQKYAHPIPSREFLLTHFEESASEIVDIDELLKAFDLEGDRDNMALEKRLAAMVRDGQLLLRGRRRYRLPDRSELQQGRIIANPNGYGFISALDEDEDVYLSRRQMRAVFHGDLVSFRVRGFDKQGRANGEIAEVLERNTHNLVGRVYFDGGAAVVEPLNRRILHDVIVNRADLADAQSSQIVVVEIMEQPTFHHHPLGRIVEILGEHLTPSLAIEIALRNQDIPAEFPFEVLEQSDNLPLAVSDEDKPGRVDLRDLPLVTIDGEDARDFDDAVCAVRNADGWCLRVAIADVAHYVTPGSALDVEAVNRGTSVYFPDFVVPMLPERLSNGLCSLKPAVDRLAMVCEMTISDEGLVTSYNFFEGIICSHARLTYTQVGEYLGGEREAVPADVRPNIDQLHALYQVLLKQREKRGALDFDTTELRVVFSDKRDGLDVDGESKVGAAVDRLEAVTRGDAHKLIEECMLCANVSAARWIRDHDMTGLYRVHARPDPEKIEHLRKYLGFLGLRLPGGALPSPRDYQALVRELDGIPGARVIQLSLLRTMAQAVYSPVNEGHFGLNYEQYTHFTSPIRRYPDLLTHRLIKSVLYRQSGKGNDTSEGSYPYSDDQVLSLGERCSMTERRADDAVYEVLEWIKCEYATRLLGDEFEGVITGVAGFGLFVELSENFVEGLIHISNLPGDYFNFDSNSQSLAGERTGRVYALGDPVKIQVVRVDVDDRKIDFELLDHQPLRSRPNPGKTEGKGNKSKSPRKKAQKGRGKRRS